MEYRVDLFRCVHVVGDMETLRDAQQQYHCVYQKGLLCPVASHSLCLFKVTLLAQHNGLIRFSFILLSLFAFLSSCSLLFVATRYHFRLCDSILFPSKHISFVTINQNT